jgi:PAS domain S-box-containing protein
MSDTAATPSEKKHASRFSGLLAAGIGATGLAGWIFDAPVFQRIHPSLVSMKANTSIALMLSGISLLLLLDERGGRAKQRLARGFAAVVTLLGLLTMGENMFGWDLGIDQFLFRESLAAAGASFPGRMGVASTVVFTCVGSALLFLDTRILGKYWASKLAVVAAVATTLVFLYYFYGIDQGDAISKYVTIALHTAVAFYALCVGIFFARPNRGVMREMLGPSMGSVVARRMLPAAFFVPILLGWLRTLGRDEGLFSPGFGTAAFVLLIILLFVGLIRWTVLAINRQEAERQQAETALRRSESRKSAILDSSLDAIITIDHGDRVLDFNPAAVRMFGFRRADIIGQRMVEKIVPLRLRERHNRGLAHYLATGEGPVLNKRIEVPALHADGHEFFIELSINRIAGVEPPVFTATLRDITDRKKAETDLRESEERFRLMADNIMQLAWMADAEGDFFWFNKRWFDYTGLTPETMKDRVWERVHDPRELCRVWERWYECVANGALWEDIFPLRGADGEFRWFLSRAVPVRDESGKVVRWFGTNTDVHDQRLIAEELVQEKERAEAASRAKDDFLAALSHELRTPLTPVLMMATALADDPTLPADVREHLAMMRRNVELEARLIDDLLDLTRISRGKLVVAPVVADVHQLLGYTAEIVLSDRLGKDVSISFRHEAARHHTLADPARLQQVFWNLIKNAIKFTPAGGSIAVSTRNDAAGRIILRVADTGVGISAEALPHIFKAFEQGDAAGQHRYGGLGLGLAISQAIMDAHHGTLSVVSEGQGRGAIFTVALASVDAPAASSQDSAAHSGSARELRLLIVEDHHASRTVLAQLLTRRGHHITTASTSKEALRLYAAGHFDAVISDLGLPDGSGLELMREIQRLRPVPAIALSGYGMEDDLGQAKEAGFSAHLVKPVNLDQLRHLIDQIASAAVAAPQEIRSTQSPEL